MAPPPIFVLSCARSGSTLTRVVLDTHPEIAAPPELHLLDTARKLLWIHGVLADGDGSGDGEGDAWAAAVPRTREHLDAVMADYCARRGRQRWCEKSVNSVLRLDVLDGVWPDARRIYLYRHAADMVASGLRAIADRPEGYGFEPYLAQWGQNRAEALLRYWLAMTERLRGHEASNGGLHLRYEDLVRQTADVLDRLQQFLELAPFDDWASHIFTADHPRGPGDAAVWSRDRMDESAIGRGRDLDLTGVPRTLVRRVNRVLRDLDYPELP